jgi:O-succinylbenzoate synthase
MKLEAVELIRMDVPLKSAFRTSFSSVNMHQVVWAHVVTDVAEGWAECGANERPDYSSEFHNGAATVI